MPCWNPHRSARCEMSLWPGPERRSGVGILITSMARRLRAFPRGPRKAQRIRDSARDLGAWAQTVRSRWGLRRFKGPIIAITGTKGKTTTALLVSRIFRDAGYRVGTACSTGIYVNGGCVIPGSYGGADGPWLAYCGGGTDVLVIETAHGGIQRYGFGFPGCDVAIFTNISDGHLGELGIESLEEMFALKWKLASRLRPGGTIILNADDARLASALPPPTAKVAYATMNQGDVACAARRMRSLYRYAGGKIIKEQGGHREALFDISEAPLLLGGVLSYNVYNLLTAVAATEAVHPLLPVSQESLSKSLLSFGAAVEDNPGRFNLFELPGGRIVLLGGSNRDSYRRDAEALARIRDQGPFPVRRLIGVVTGIGMQSDDYMRDLVRIASAVCDEIVVREPLPRHRRGRRPGEIPSILAAAALEAGLPEERIRWGGDSCAWIQDLLFSSGERDHLVAVFCAHAQEPILDLCRGVAELANDWRLCRGITHPV